MSHRCLNSGFPIACSPPARIPHCSTEPPRFWAADMGAFPSSSKHPPWIKNWYSSNEPIHSCRDWAQKPPPAFRQSGRNIPAAPHRCRIQAKTRLDTVNTPKAARRSNTWIEWIVSGIVLPLQIHPTPPKRFRFEDYTAFFGPSCKC